MQSNPFREGLPRERAPEPCALVIFGATGDLTRRKLVPALYNIARDRLLPAEFAVVGFARREWTDQHFREEMLDGVNKYSRNRPVQPEIWDDFARGLRFVSGEFGESSDYQKLVRSLEALDRERGTRGNRLLYLATPPDRYAEILGLVGSAGLAGRTGGGWSRVIIEKPFGRDLESARELNRRAHEVLAEDQIYRIDHYLGKETVQNIMVMRFGNGIFEPLWNRRHIDHVQITVAEDIGIEMRGAYYDSAGAMRDMVQNHMLQLVSLTAMEPPVTLAPDEVRDEKVKVLRAVRPIAGSDVARDVVRARYGRGSIAGRDVAAFREEKGVAPGSTTETYVALRLQIDNWRWAGVPFFLRTGKRLPKRATEIAIQFKEAPHLLFARQAASGIEPNVLALRIQPDEGISLKMTSKTPGAAVALQPVVMEFRYGTSFGAEPPEAYERLLLDCMSGDSTLFTRRDEVEEAWAFVTRILEAWAASDAAPPLEYEAGTWGPAEADLLTPRWRRL